MLQRSKLAGRIREDDMTRRPSPMIVLRLQRDSCMCDITHLYVTWHKHTRVAKKGNYIGAAQRGVAVCNWLRPSQLRPSLFIVVHVYTCTRTKREQHCCSATMCCSIWLAAKAILIICIHVYTYTHKKRVQHWCSATRSCRPWQVGRSNTRLYIRIFAKLQQGNHIVAVQRGITGCDRLGKAILVYMYIYTHIPKGNHIVAVQRKIAGCDRAGHTHLYACLSHLYASISTHVQYACISTHVPYACISTHVPYACISTHVP